MPCKPIALFVFSVVCALTSADAFAQKVSPSAEPTAENMAEWTAHILPEQSDLVWRNVAWQTTFGDGVVAANEADKPLLLWVMNGHPFGCT